MPPPLDIRCLVAGETVGLDDLEWKSAACPIEKSTTSAHLHQGGGVREMEQVNHGELLKTGESG